MGYFVAATHSSLTRVAVTITGEQFTDQRISLGALTSAPHNITLTIRGIGTQWPNKDFRVHHDSGETWVMWDQQSDGLHDVVQTGDDFLIEFTH